MSETLTGRCLCGGVAFEIDPPLAPPAACHCSQCRRMSGHFWAAFTVPMGRFRMLSDDTLRWHRSSERAERGFCGTCGGFLFWRETGQDGNIDVAAGTLDLPTGMRLVDHIFVADKGDYYEIGDGLPTYPASRGFAHPAEE